MADRAARPDGPFSALGLSVVAATIAVDQAAKLIADATLVEGHAVDVLPFLALYRVNNTGIAFSMFSGLGALPLTLLTLAITGAVLVMWHQARDGGRPAAIGFALIVGGALGNLIDRMLWGHVIDFLLLHLGGRVLFVFNLADAALTLGPALLLFVYLWPRRT